MNLPCVIIPQPKSMSSDSTHFTLSANAQIFYDPQSRSVVTYLAELLRATTGYALSTNAIDSGVDPKEGDLVFTCKEGAEPSEHYLLTVTPAGVRASAESAAGLFYAVQSVRQLLLTVGEKWVVPSVVIDDKPVFKWRGMMLDVCRHMFPVEFIKKFIDLLALHKFNSFHWHLTEDQGWRIEIDAYPKLAEIAAWRDATPYPADRNTLDGKRYGGSYTKDEVREVVAYAQERFITVIPEIEMPGHSVAALTAYPELGCVGNGYKVREFWGIEEDVFCAGKEETFLFLENVLQEVIDLFPGEFIHIGGDECPKDRWQECTDCQARIEEEELHNEDELQSYFVRRVEKFINTNGRKLVGWDEILEGGLAPNATVMSWRGSEGGIAAASAGHDVVMSPNSHCYLDYYQSKNQENEPPAIGNFISLEKSYEFDPTAGIPADKQHHVLGGQANLWSEYTPTPADVEYMIYPRGCAIAEAVWSGGEERDFADFQTRLAIHQRHLQAMDVNYRPLDKPIE